MPSEESKRLLELWRSGQTEGKVRDAAVEAITESKISPIRRELMESSFPMKKGESLHDYNERLMESLGESFGGRIAEMPGMFEMSEPEFIPGKMSGAERAMTLAGLGIPALGKVGRMAGKAAKPIEYLTSRGVGPGVSRTAFMASSSAAGALAAGEDPWEAALLGAAAGVGGEVYGKLVDVWNRGFRLPRKFKEADPISLAKAFDQISEGTLQAAKPEELKALVFGGLGEARMKDYWSRGVQRVKDSIGFQRVRIPELNPYIGDGKPEHYQASVEEALDAIADLGTKISGGVAKSPTTLGAGRLRKKAMDSLISQLDDMRPQGGPTIWLAMGDELRRLETQHLKNRTLLDLFTVRKGNERVARKGIINNDGSLNMSILQKYARDNKVKFDKRLGAEAQKLYNAVFRGGSPFGQIDERGWVGAKAVPLSARHNAYIPGFGLPKFAGDTQRTIAPNIAAPVMGTMGRPFMERLFSELTSETPEDIE